MIEKIFISLITFYQRYVSFALKILLGTPKFCYQTPTCSEFTKQSIKRYGIVTGLRKGVVRILSCRPTISSYA